MSKHTPGPWHVDGAKPHQIVLHTEKTNLLRVASVNTQFTGTYAANARLIAAAPEMLEALKYARRFLKSQDVDTAFVDAAIAKAEGRQP